MDPELGSLASAAAKALIGLMVSDSWVQAKERLTRLFARDGSQTNTSQRLQQSRAELVTAHAMGNGALIAAIEDEWRIRVLELLRSAPTVIEELCRLLRLPAPVSYVYNFNSGGVGFGSVIQTGQITGAVFDARPEAEERSRKGAQEEQEPGGGASNFGPY